jgi:hypothetical protein
MEAFWKRKRFQGPNSLSPGIFGGSLSRLSAPGTKHQDEPLPQAHPPSSSSPAITSSIAADPEPTLHLMPFWATQ